MVIATVLGKHPVGRILHQCSSHVLSYSRIWDSSLCQAKLIEFNPIRATDVVLPDQAVFVISNTCSEVNKAATDYFNVRVAECRLATQVG